MKKRNFLFKLTRMAVAVSLVVLAGCSLTPVKPSVINAAQVDQAPPPPQPVFGSQDHAAACLGDVLAAQKIQPLVIGYSTMTETSGKVAVDFPAVTRSELGKITSRVPNIIITAVGFGPSAKPEVPGVEERMLRQDPALAARLLRPDVLISGGTVSVSNAFLSLQKSGGLSARDLSLSGSRTSSVDLVSISLGLKSADNGADIGRTVDRRVSYQLLSNATEAGVFAQAKLDGRSLSAGLHFGRTVAVSQIAEDAIRVGIADALLRLLAARYSVDIDAVCPTHVVVPDDQLPKAAQLPTANELPKIYQAMTPGERIKWFQSTLAARGYDPGEADGQLGSRTRQALVRVAHDSNLPAIGQVTDVLFYVLAMRDIAFGRDPRKTLSSEPAKPAAPQRISVQLNQPNAPYATGVFLRANVVVPQAGYMHCWLVSPDGALSLYPVMQGRGNYATAAQPVPLPDPNTSGAHPRVRLTTPGAHELWCGEARSNITQRLPAELLPGGQGYATVAAIRDAFVKASGTDWVAEGSAQFKVFEPQPAR